MRPLRKPEDLQYHLLLHDDTPLGGDDRPDWVQWLKGVGVDDIDTSRGLHFNHAMLGLEAAIDGLGVVLGIKELAARDIAAGRLVAPFEYSMALPNSYYLVSAETVAQRPKVAAFRTWLLEEVRLRLSSKTLAG
jgi:LysR family glycine cleavage system transcriptional activator